MIDTTLSGLDANAYLSIAEADAYHLARGNADWGTASSDEKSAAIIRATDFIDANFLFKSVPATDDQALENPRYGEDALNAKLTKATAQLSLHMLTDNTSTKAISSIVQEAKELEGVGSQSTTYGDKPSDPYPFITKLLTSGINSPATRRGASAGNLRVS